MNPRIHESNAERQRAYRARSNRADTAQRPAATTKAPRRTRPARLAIIVQALRDLADEYQGWVNAIPENLLGGPLAESIETTIEQLTEAADGLDAIETPRIGR